MKTPNPPCEINWCVCLAADGSQFCTVHTLKADERPLRGRQRLRKLAVMPKRRRAAATSRRPLVVNTPLPLSASPSA